jgi:hypothetical protein
MSTSTEGVEGVEGVERKRSTGWVGNEKGNRGRRRKKKRFRFKFGVGERTQRLG